MIQLTLQFKTAEEAIVALAKMSGGAAAKAAGQVDAKVTSGGATPAVAQPGPVAPKGRKPRADAGQPRGPNARTQNANSVVEAGTGSTVGAGAEVAGGAVTDAGKAAEQAANSMSTPESPAAAPEPAASVTAGPVEIPKTEEAEAALTKLFETKGLKVAQETLGAFGVKRLKELLPEDRAKFIAAAKAAL